MTMQNTNPTDALVSLISHAVINEIKHYIDAPRRPICERDALQMLGLKDARTLKEWCNQGLECYTIGRQRYYFSDEIEDFIRSAGGSAN